MSDDPRWENVREDWLPDDGLRDVFIADDTEEDWRKVASWILSRPEWSTTYTEDGEQVEMPDVAEVMSRSANASILWAISLGDGVTANAYLQPGDNHVDFDPREILGPMQFERVCDFVKSVGNVVGKRVEVRAESSRPGDSDDGLVMTFDPITRTFG